MSGRISIVELPDGEILIDGQPTDFAPPWKTEDAIRQQARDIDQLRADLAAAVAERDQLRARLAAIEAAPVVARVAEIKRDFASGPYRCLDYDSDKLPAGNTELIARLAKDAT